MSGGSFPDAGGILNDAGGTVTVRDSTISGNSATRSGGAVQDIGGGANDFDIVNTTISGNHAGLRGGAIQEGGGHVKLLNATVHDNAAAGGADEIDVCAVADPACGGSNPHVITVQNSIVSSGSGNCLGAVTSAGHNMDGGDTCGFHAAGDLVNTDPLLDPLGANGGPTLTHAERAGSPAIDNGDPSACPATDQRGVARPAGPACDMGAFETANPAPTSTPAPPSPPAPAQSAGAPPKVTFNDVVRLPSTKRCTSRRLFQIHLRKVRGVTIVSATVKVSGRTSRVVRGKRLTSAINLRGLPRGRFTVRITLKTSTGRTITGTRRYRTCTPKRRGTSKHKL